MKNLSKLNVKSVKFNIFNVFFCVSECPDHFWFDKISFLEQLVLHFNALQHLQLERCFARHT